MANDVAEAELMDYSVPTERRPGDVGERGAPLLDQRARHRNDRKHFKAREELRVRGDRFSDEARALAYDASLRRDLLTERKELWSGPRSDLQSRRLDAAAAAAERQQTEDDLERGRGGGGAPRSPEAGDWRAGAARARTDARRLQGGRSYAGGGRSYEGGGRRVDAGASATRTADDDDEQGDAPEARTKAGSSVSRKDEDASAGAGDPPAAAADAAQQEKKDRPPENHDDIGGGVHDGYEGGDYYDATGYTEKRLGQSTGDAESTEDRQIARRRNGDYGDIIHGWSNGYYEIHDDTEHDIESDHFVPPSEARVPHRARPTTAIKSVTVVRPRTTSVAPEGTTTHSDDLDTQLWLITKIKHWMRAEKYRTLFVVMGAVSTLGLIAILAFWTVCIVQTSRACKHRQEGYRPLPPFATAPFDGGHVGSYPLSGYQISDSAACKHGNPYPRPPPIYGQEYVQPPVSNGCVYPHPHSHRQPMHRRDNVTSTRAEQLSTGARLDGYGGRTGRQEDRTIEAGFGRNAAASAGRGQQRQLRNREDRDDGDSYDYDVPRPDGAAAMAAGDECSRERAADRYEDRGLDGSAALAPRHMLREQAADPYPEYDYAGNDDDDQDDQSDWDRLPQTDVQHAAGTRKYDALGYDAPLSTLPHHRRLARVKDARPSPRAQIDAGFPPSAIADGSFDALYAETSEGLADEDADWQPWPVDEAANGRAVFAPEATVTAPRGRPETTAREHTAAQRQRIASPSPAPANENANARRSASGSSSSCDERATCLADVSAAGALSTYDGRRHASTSRESRVVGQLRGQLRSDLAGSAVARDLPEEEDDGEERLGREDGDAALHCRRLTLARRNGSPSRRVPGQTAGLSLSPPAGMRARCRRASPATRCDCPLDDCSSGRGAAPSAPPPLQPLPTVLRRKCSRSALEAEAADCCTGEDPCHGPQCDRRAPAISCCPRACRRPAADGRAEGHYPGCCGAEAGAAASSGALATDVNTRWRSLCDRHHAVTAANHRAIESPLRYYPVSPADTSASRQEPDSRSALELTPSAGGQRTEVEEACDQSAGPTVRSRANERRPAEQPSRAAGAYSPVRSTNPFIDATATADIVPDFLEKNPGNILLPADLSTYRVVLLR